MIIAERDGQAAQKVIELSSAIIMDSFPCALLLFSLLCSATGQGPEVSVEPQVTTVREGESVSLRCQVASGTHSTQLQWRKANNQALADNIKIGPNGVVLTVANARPNNQGEYQCVATSAAGSSVASAQINIKFPPNVRLSPAGPLRVKIGDRVSVQCRATGRPRPKLSWRRQDSALQLPSEETDGVSTIQWTVVRAEDAGVYICQAENTVGKTEVKLEVIMGGGPGAPIASVSHKEMTVVEGRSVTIRCQATGSPPPVITWSKLRAPLPWKHTVAGGVLTLTSVGRQDSGQYICNATNIQGFSEAYTQIEVESPPYATVMPEQVKVQPGDALTLRCLAHGSHPIQFQWSRVGRGNLPAGSQTTIDGQLVIARVRMGDGGSYKCVSTNHIGSSEALAKVIVKG
ncbi:basement membrane-specific heparan sulfate proteoglycan core protein-like [Syngnathus acus]|uniref:basement membrane-specific heparan sulfate proteoglycan core protein-like n=1 Tax=Syngnathus acus TaxID=161584 RepID=UPI00188628C3|nr:basement membrane-specific heparan sulfate proteoglycan core protein-like [Syngnathus acus]